MRNETLVSLVELKSLLKQEMQSAVPNLRKVLSLRIRIRRLEGKHKDD
jgi:hypothetical protein